VATVAASSPGTADVRARSGGTAVITARVDGKEGRATIVVEARRVARIDLSQPVLGLEFTKSGWVGATTVAQDGHYIAATITWSSSDSTVVSVEPSGKMTARSPGSAFVTASVGEVRAEVYVTAAGPVLAGSWRLLVQDLEDGRTRCSVNGVHLRTIVSGTQVSGGSESWSSPSVACDVIGTEGPFTSPHAPVGALQGSIHGTSVLLSIDGWTLNGAFTGPDRIEGSAQYYEAENGYMFPRVGRFVLVRQ
jgi:uncharacterized protein YjdB